MSKTIISDKYQVVIPKAVREKLNLKRGQVMYVYSTKDSSILMCPEKKWPEDYIKDLKEVWKDVDVVNYLHTERSSWE